MYAASIPVLVMLLIPPKTHDDRNNNETEQPLCIREPIIKFSPHLQSPINDALDDFSPLYVMGIAFIPGSHDIVSCGIDRVVREWYWDSIRGASRRRFFPEMRLRGRCVAYGDGGKVLACGGRHDFFEAKTNSGQSPIDRQEGCVYLWGDERERFVGTLITDRGQVESVQFTDRSQLVAIGTNAGTCEIWKYFESSQLLDQYMRMETLTHSLSDTAVRAVFSPDGSMIACIDNEKAKVWSVQEGPHGSVRIEFMREFEAHGHLSFSSDGRRLAMYHVGDVQIWNLDSDSMEMKLTRVDDQTREVIDQYQMGWLGDLVILPGDTHLIQAYSRIVTIWNLEERRRVAFILVGTEANTGISPALSVSTDGSLLATADKTSPEVAIWDLSEILNNIEND